MSEQLLQAILAELKQLNNPPKLGFSRNPLDCVFIGQKAEGSCWYRVHDGKVLPITEDRLGGYLERLDIALVQREGVEVEKLHIYIDAGSSTVRIECGINTNFGASLLRALLSLNDLSQLITILVRPGDKSSIVFASVSVNGDRIKTDGNQPIDFRLATEALNKRLHPEMITSTARTPNPNLDRLRQSAAKLGLSRLDGDDLIKWAIHQTYPDRKTRDMSESEVIAVQRFMLAANTVAG